MLGTILRNAACTLVLVGAATVALDAPASAQTPDVIVWDIGVWDSNTNDIAYYGQSGGIAAYSIATQSCNQGTKELDWYDSGGDTRHPVIGQNMFRYKDGRFEQIGQSWLKHGFCAVNETESGCAPCQTSNCDTLGIGCADTYWATLNDGQGGGSKRFVNAALGSHNENSPNPSGPNAIRGRLQVAVADIDPAQNVGAEYFIEGQYVTEDDAAASALNNNASWRRVNVVSISNVNGGGPTHRMDPAIYAWQDQDPSVVVRALQNTGEGPARTAYYLAYKVTSTGPDSYHYEYALQNLSSDQSANSFSLSVAAGATISSIGFHDVDYHSGDPYDGTDWVGQKSGGDMTWSTTDFATNNDANALRWGTMYNFRFDSNYAPADGLATIGIFKPGPSSSILVSNVPVPSIPGAGKQTRRQATAPPLPPISGGVQSASAASRSGSRVNQGGELVETSSAVVGQNWNVVVDMAGGERSVLYISLGGPAEGTFTKMGEWLIQEPILSDHGAGEHSIPIPNDPSFVGLSFSTQAAVLTSKGWKLSNALDVVIGEHDPR